MAKDYQFNWRKVIPPELAKGQYFDRYDDVSRKERKSAGAFSDCIAGQHLH